MNKLDELQTKLLDLCDALALATDAYGVAVAAYWQAEHEYRKAKALAFTRHVAIKFDGKKPTDAHLAALVDIDCEMERLAERVGNLDRHFGQAAKDIEEIRVSSDKAGRRARRLDNFDFEELGSEPVAPLILKDAAE